MAIEKEEGMSTAESLRQTRTYGKFRCHNPTCMERIQPEKGKMTAKCPTCGMEYRVHWVNPTLPRIRGPVWEIFTADSLRGLRTPDNAAVRNATKWESLIRSP
jgi:predicted RNA-binding Zn-ribbon protein involved in translation (DUF1610 family)